MREDSDHQGAFLIKKLQSIPCLRNQEGGVVTAPLQTLMQEHHIEYYEPYVPV